MKKTSSTGMTRMLSQPLIWDHVVGVLCLITGALLMARLLWLASYHFEATDDSFYILSALYPEDIVLKGTWFDRYTGFLWSLSSNSLAGFRRAGIIGLCLGSAALSIAISMWLRSLKPCLLFWPTAVLVFNGLLFGNLVYYQLFLLTPSYNWLALLGMTLAGAGVFLHLAGKKAVVAIGFLGVGGFLTFAGKPITGLLLLALIFALFVIATPTRRSLPVLLGAVSTAGGLVLAHMIVLDGGVSASISKIYAGQDATALLIPGRSIGAAAAESLEFFVQLPALTWKIFPVSLTTLVIVLILLAVTWPGLGRAKNMFAQGALLVFVAAWVWDVWTFGHFRQPYSMHVLLVLPLGMLCIFMLAFLRTPKDSECAEISAQSLISVIAPVVFLLICPFLYSFGTNNRIAYHTMSAAGFVGSAALILAVLGHIYSRQIVVSILVSLALLVWGNEAIKAAQLKPYRAGMPVSQMDAVLELPAPIGTLMVTPTMAAYSDQLRKTAQSAGFEPQTPLIDLTGGSPGAAVLLNARFVGVAWTLGGYAGSESFLDFVFERVPAKTLQSAWVLQASGGARAYPSTVLTRRGLAFPENYRLVGEIEGGPSGETQQLWAPKVR